MIETLAIGLGLVKTTLDVAEKVREWRSGDRQEVGLATSRAGQAVALPPDPHAVDLSQFGLFAGEAAWGLLHVVFEPADEVAQERLANSDPTLVVIWDIRDYEGIGVVFHTCELGGGLTLDLPEGPYNIAAFVFDEHRDDIRGEASFENLFVPGHDETIASLFVYASESEWISHELLGDAPPAPAELVFGDGVAIPVYDEASLGRAPDSYLPFEDDTTVSAHHAVIQIGDDGRYWISDTNSTNGTFVDGRRISSCPLHHGAVISIGAQEMLFRYR